MWEVTHYVYCFGYINMYIDPEVGGNTLCLLLWLHKHVHRCRIGLWFVSQRRSYIGPGHMTVEINGRRSQNISGKIGNQWEKELHGDGGMHIIALVPDLARNVEV